MKLVIDKEQLAEGIKRYHSSGELPTFVLDSLKRVVIHQLRTKFRSSNLDGDEIIGLTCVKLSSVLPQITGGKNIAGLFFVMTNSVILDFIRGRSASKRSAPKDYSLGELPSVINTLIEPHFDSRNKVYKYLEDKGVYDIKETYTKILPAKGPRAYL